VKRWIKRIIATFLVLGLVGAVVYAFLPKPVPVDVARVEIGNLQVCVEEDGKTRLRDRYVVSSPLAGRLRRIRLRPGDRVPPGQTLAVIEPADPELLDPRTLATADARVKAAKATLEKAGAQLKWNEHALELAETDYARAQVLHEKKSISKGELDTKMMQKRTRDEDLRTARFAEEVARFELEQARAALMRTRPQSDEFNENTHFEIPSPTLSNSGVVFHVLRVLQESEAVVTAGTPLIELGDLSDLEVEIDVLSSDAVRIPPQAKVLLEQWGGDEPLEARVRLVEPYGRTKISALGVEEQRVNVIAEFPDRTKIPATLGDGFRVEARIVLWEKGDVLKVPTSALFRHGEGWAVFLVEADRAVLRPIKVGKKNGLAAEVIDGLSESDSVVVHPGDKVAHGVQVVRRS
jgi:HlyD family secretion protein